MFATELVRYLDSLILVHLQSNYQGPPLRHKAKRQNTTKKGIAINYGAFSATRADD